ncbi:hypothetical protein BKA70DRAFT_1234747 [Coprinopsis sp. MPI-PUGE-AT-0042]|nr:hypothetical protein BKA70DRAFT_1234747 [Coprinopsis sp. MPI-PUGE-AT-0042]
MSKQPLILMDTDPPSVRVAPSSHMLMCSPAELLPLLTGMALDPYIDNARDNAREKGDARNIPMKDGSIVHEGFVAKFLDDGSAAMIEVEDKPKVKRRSAWTTNSRGESPSKFNNLHGLPGLKVKTATVKVIDDESISISSEDDGWREEDLGRGPGSQHGGYQVPKCMKINKLKQYLGAQKKRLDEEKEQDVRRNARSGDPVVATALRGEMR